MRDRGARRPAAPSDAGRTAAAAGWLAEALTTGNPLAPLPPELAPRTVREGERLALAVLEEAGLVACGLRVAPGPGGGRPVAGPVVESRLLPDGAAIALPTLRHAAVSAAVVGVLARELTRTGAPEEPPEFSALHPAIDVAASRFRDPPGTPALLAADLGGLGFVVVGRRVAVPPAGGGSVPVAVGPAGAAARGRRRGGAEAAPAVDLFAALAPAAAAARRMGGLPAGALLVAAGLSPRIAPAPGTALRARFGRLGRVDLAFT